MISLQNMLCQLEDFEKNGGHYNQMSWGGKKEVFFETLVSKTQLIEREMENITDTQQLEKMNNDFWTKLELLKKIKENDPDLANWVTYNLKFINLH